MLTLNWLVFIPSALLVYSLWNVFGILRNYLLVRSSRLPVYLSPGNPGSIPYMIFSVPLKPLIQRLIPASVFDRMKPTFYGWEFFSKYELHEKFGETFYLATPGPLDLWTSDPDAGNDILRRPKDFGPMILTEKIVGLFGPNLLTAHGEDWKRQRRIIAPNFNEGVSDLVWSESCKQATEMLEYFLGSANGETDRTVDGLRLIAVHVIGQAGYGMHESWKDAMKKSSSNVREKTITYVEAVHAVINLLIMAALIPTTIFQLPIMPPALQRLGQAKRQFGILTKQMLEKEREEGKTGEITRKNLMSTLIKLSDEGKNGKIPASGKAQFLSEEEISGNLFLFTAAGYDTTANTMAYGITMLAAEPKWQDWVFEEIKEVLGVARLGDPLDYEEVFPRLIRCRAYMFEILRLYNPLVHIARTNTAPQPLQTSTGTHLLPPNTKIYVNTAALATLPRIWGPDALSFLPSRWLDSEGVLRTMPKGTFLPWSGGPRVCPGQKMAQVEFVAVLATVLRRARIEVVVGKGQSVEQARGRLWGVMADSQSRLTLQMNRPRDVKLRWIER